MNFTSIPIIVLCCYVLGEIYKFLFQKRKKAYKFIPTFVALTGGLIGILIFLTNPEILLNADNIWTALGIGIISGLSSTGTNQIIKQFIKKKRTMMKSYNPKID